MTAMTDAEIDRIAHRNFLATMDAIANRNTVEFTRRMGIGFYPSGRRMSRNTGTWISDIKIEVANFYHLTVRDLESRDRTKPVAMARHIAMYLSRKLTDRSIAQIGIAFDHRDHTTVITAIKKIERLRTADAQIADDILKLTRLFGVEPL